MSENKLTYKQSELKAKSGLRKWKYLIDEKYEVKYIERNYFFTKETTFCI